MKESEYTKDELLKRIQFHHDAAHFHLYVYGQLQNELDSLNKQNEPEHMKVINEIENTPEQSEG